LLKGDDKAQISTQKLRSVFEQLNHKFLKWRNMMKKNILVIGGIIAVALLLVGAAFIGGRLLNGLGLGQSTSNDSGPSLTGPNGPVAADFEPAKELPQRPAEVSGLFDHHQDKSIFIKTGGMVTVQRDKSGNVTGDSTGQAVEVVVTSQTTIYSDVTIRQFDGPPADGQTIQQVLEPGSLDDIGPVYHVLVWGRKTGDRFIADVLVYSAP
jgi:hypothetical protein